MKNPINLPMGFRGQMTWIFDRLFKQTPRVIITTAAILCLTPKPGLAESAIEKPTSTQQWKLEAGPEYFYWREDANGQKLLDESGLRNTIDLSSKKVSAANNWLTTIQIKFYYGHVNYDGHYFDGTPVKSTTDYYGGSADFGIGYRWTSVKGRYLDLVGRLGVEDWERELNSSGGYNENWLPLYFKLGVETSREKKGWTGSLGVKIPIYTWQHVYLSKFGAGTLKLHPSSMPSAYADFGYVFTRHLSVTVFFDSYWFSQSPTVSNGYVVRYQPESITYQAGIKVGWAF